MGRYIFRRTNIILILLVGIVTMAAGSHVGPLEPLMSIQPKLTNGKEAYKKSRRGHTGPKAWSPGFETDLFVRSDVEYWIDRWSDDAGLRKLQSAMERAFEFRTEVGTILRNAGIPWELLSIPIVESNWQINIVSPSGAMGPWQFLESTGRGRGLIIDTWRDERRDIWRSTEAASEELLFSYRIFGDWPLTIAAYNAGPTRLRKLKNTGNYTNFWTMLDEGIIPPETQNYVPQVIAVAYIQAHAGRMGLPLKWKKPERWFKIQLNRSLHFNQLTAIPGVDNKLLHEGNQELHQSVTPPSIQDYIVKIPAGDLDETEIRSFIDNIEDAPERFWRYVVQPEDSLSSISRSLNIPINDIMKYNPSLEMESLRIGRHVYVPGTNTPVPGIAADEIPRWEGQYRVKPGDSLWSISRLFGVSPELLAEMNYRPVHGILHTGSLLWVPTEEEGK